MGHLTRQPTSNEQSPAQSKNQWLGENELADERFLLISRFAKRCKGGCGRAIRVEHLDDQQCCPDCRGDG